MESIILENIMKCKKCGEKLIFINSDDENGLIGYWLFLKCREDK